MKIAIVTEHFLPKTDGIVTRLCQTLYWLKARGHEVRIYTIGNSPGHYLGFRVYPLKSVYVPFYSERQLVIPTKQVQQLMDEWSPDLVHAINPSLLGLYALHYSKKKSWPSILSLHTDYAQYADYYHVSFAKSMIWGLIRHCAHRADIILASSPTMQQKFQQHHIQAQLWKYGSDTEKLSPNNRNAAMRNYLTQGASNKFLFICVGRLAAEKDLLRLKDILIQYPNTCLALIGDGPMKEKLTAHFAGTACFVTGFMDKEQLAQAYASADAMVFPSQTETLGLVLLEAMASGLPVVAARAGGIVDLVDDGVNGLLFDPASKTDFLNKCAEMMNNTDLVKTLVHNASAMARNATWQAATDDLIGKYQETVQLRVAQAARVTT